MSSLEGKVRHFWSELRRRKTIRTAVAYLIIIAAVVGPASDILDGLGAPQWILQTIIIGLFVGFPIVLVFSWVFDFTFHGIERTADIDAEQAQVEEKSALETPDVIDDIDKPSVDIETGTAHRYQITLLRMTLVLTEQESVVNDPEEMAEVLPELQAMVSSLAEKYSAMEVIREGATYYFVFGYPNTYEDDAIRAVLMALAINEDLHQFAEEKYESSSFSLIATSGVHSDLVVIDKDESKNSGINIVGTATQETAWVQSLTEPGSVALDQSTHQLLRNRVLCEVLGEHNNSQTNELMMLYLALETNKAQLDPSVYDDFHSQFLGRDSEIDLVMDRWERAREGEDQFLVLRGEPGIGKSTILREVANRVQDTPDVLVMPFYCSPIERNTAFQPIKEYILGPGLGLRRSSSLEERTDRIKKLLENLKIDIEHAVPLVNSLLSLDKGESEGFDESARRDLINCLLEIVRATAKQRPLLLIVEDLHWADPSSLETFGRLVNEASDTGILCLFTTRPYLNIPWESRSNITTLDLQKLSRRSTIELVNNILSELNLPEEFVLRLVSEAGGNPLFAEELAKAIFETAQANPNQSVKDLVLPGSLQRSLASRVDNLGKAKPLLQLCSLLGREFDYEILSSVSQTQDASILEEELELLVNAEFLYQKGSVPESSYSFKHIQFKKLPTRQCLNPRASNFMSVSQQLLKRKKEVLIVSLKSSHITMKVVCN